MLRIERSQLEHYRKPLMYFLLTLVGCILLSQFQVDWSSWRLASCMPDHCFCEHVRLGKTVRQPANSWSNLAFTLIGFFLLGLQKCDEARSEKRTSLISSKGFTLLFAWTMVFMGVTSLFYHASLTFLGQWFDVLVMYLIANFIWIYNLARKKNWTSQKFISAYLITNALSGYIQYAWPEARRYLFAALLVIAIFSEIYMRFAKHTGHHNTKYIIYSLLSFVLAFTIWNLDAQKIVCWPHSLLQGHALWHILCASAAGFIYLYFRSEVRETNS